MYLTRWEWISGIATTILVIIAGTISFDYVNLRYAGKSARDAVSENEQHDASGPGNKAGPCVDADGSWKNWPYSNVPMLAPKCEDVK